jgi:hypothetical protein
VSGARSQKSGAPHGEERVKIEKKLALGGPRRFQRSLPLGQSAVCKEGGTFHLETSVTVYSARSGSMQYFSMTFRII